MDDFTIDLPDGAATDALGYVLGQKLFPGAVVALNGPLGAGKTRLVRAVADGLGVANLAAVNSPTFVLIQEYIGRLPIAHFDTYRLGSPREFAELGVSEYFEAGGVCLIEWADKVAGELPADRLTLTLTVTGPTTRRATLAATGPQHAKLLAELAAR
jgi:tRNA threonylcarbamoyladenosine biosynthesis protein TsaE